jgi:predicted Zn-dependent peptidase
MEIAVAQLVDVAAGNVTAAELGRAKENIKGRILLGLESTSNRMTRLGRATVTNMPILPIPQIIKRTEAVSADDVAGLARELLAPEKLSAAGIGPHEGLFREAVGRVSPGLLKAAA